MMLIDAHCHVANLANESCIADLIVDAQQQGVGGFISTALTIQEAQWHLANPHPAVKWGVGIHPIYPDCDLRLQDIRDLAANRSISLVGEIGLDRNNPDLKWQLEMFEQQIQIAETSRLPIVIHLVGHIHTAVEMLKAVTVPILVHGYAGSIEGYSSILRLGCYFTISSRLLKKQDLLQQMISDGRYMFESDATLSDKFLEGVNPLIEVSELVNKIDKDTSRAALIATQEANVQRFIGIFSGSI